MGYDCPALDVDFLMIEYNTDKVVALLQNHGWRSCGERADGNEHWTRPGKRGGTSATMKDRMFYVFSSNAAPFEPNGRRLETMGRLVEAYRPECVIELIWQACITYDVESNRIKHYAEETLGIPYLRIETDYSPSDSARIAVRVEALFETLRASG